jgi:hypothetical protein
VIGDNAGRAGTRPQAILDALKNPKRIISGVDSLGRPYEVFIGEHARVVVNPQTGKIVSVNPLSGIGAHWGGSTMIERHHFKLTADEWQYLQRLAENDETLAKLLQSHEQAHSLVIVSLSIAEAEEVRDRLVIQLALVGFDENYNPTEEGQMLEDLIDKFYVP